MTPKYTSTRRPKTDFEKCTTFKPGKRCTISCKLGLWSVNGPDGADLRNEAHHYYEQYKAAGEYSSIIGGPTVLDALRDSGLVKM